MSSKILVEISPGELIDKLTILEIKLDRIGDAAKLANVRREYEPLKETLRKGYPETTELAALTTELKRINQALWDIEDDIRDCERASDFGDLFIKLARSVYRTNDERAAVKHRINTLLGSAIIEEKSYAKY
ncbi:DUF6165 family protein [Reyranella sp.]|uniref:DUF6165 family protein n=1 Tax=Reyranella sp. TaxID=1929291 RepID=UPI003BAB51F9